MGILIIVRMQAQGQITLDSLAEQPVTPEQELQTLTQLIRTWKELESESREMRNELREKTKQQKALSEMILRIMKKHNIGALDLKESGARLLYRRTMSKETLNIKNLTDLLTAALGATDAAEKAVQYITEHRGSKVREKLLYEA
jgi:hypothetical protein